jgi:hypothetical protein
VPTSWLPDGLRVASGWLLVEHEDSSFIIQPSAFPGCGWLWAGLPGPSSFFLLPSAFTPVWLWVACPKTAVQTAKYTKHTKDERLMNRTRLTCRADTLVAPNLPHFVCFVYFVVPSALSGFKHGRGASLRRAPSWAPSRGQESCGSRCRAFVTLVLLPGDRFPPPGSTRRAGGDHTTSTGHSHAGLAVPAEIVPGPPIREGERPRKPWLPEIPGDVWARADARPPWKCNTQCVEARSLRTSPKSQARE